MHSFNNLLYLYFNIFSSVFFLIKIRLIANQAHVDTLVEYGIFDEYDGIDVSMLTQMPYKETVLNEIL